ncbi:hypothetical protein CCS01_01630 [Rhodopila globiformis]|uniref:DUF29 domain-containing protein n=2 Tax=Rhodopila globiformis TaxID=1071 RepID=A0A2S6NNI2_RHOGL|nr:hypothetical protein CCS01_01630 [Rhodopila globiformis]
MPDGLYERDILAWSENQADRLRRLARGEQVNDIDWAHVAEEIEDVGLSELRSVESFLTLVLVHLLKLHTWPGNEACAHWRGEVVGFQDEAERRFSPSMRQRIDLGKLYAGAVRRLQAIDPNSHFPAENPFFLDQLLTGDLDELLARLPRDGT